jgi:hypothetical protein
MSPSYAFVLVCLAALPTFAAEPSPAVPTSDEIKRVLEFHESGKDQGPVLLDLVACLKVDTVRNSPTVYSCLEPVLGPVKKNATVSAWTAWFCPKGGSYEDVAIQFLHEGQVRTTLDVKVEGGWKSRTFRSHTLAKSGTWQVKVIRGAAVLGSVTVQVE